MKNYVVLIFAILSVSFAPLTAQSEHNTKNTSNKHLLPETYQTATGSLNEAILASSTPNHSRVSVYLQVDSGYEHDIETLAPIVLSYFEFYEIPVLLVKQDIALSGKKALVRVYVNGEVVAPKSTKDTVPLIFLQKYHKELFDLIKIRWFQTQIDDLSAKIDSLMNSVK